MHQCRNVLLLFVSLHLLDLVSAGFTSGLGLLVGQVAFGSFIFSGALAPYSSQGVGLILFGNFAACLLVALVGGYRGRDCGTVAGAGDHHGHDRCNDGG